jgi:predicted heme/steroid binding protein
MHWAVVLIISSLIAFLFFLKKRMSGSSTNESAQFSDTDTNTCEDMSDTEEERLFTIKELAEFNGEGDKKPIYLSVMGHVFDVTHSNFYGPNDPYHIFAGKDASINLATSSLEESTLNQIDISNLSKNVLNDMYGQVDYYSMKYRQVGWLKEWIEKNGKRQFDNPSSKTDEDKKNE